MPTESTLHVLTLSGIPEIRIHDDLGTIIGDALERTSGALPLTDADVLVVTQKVVSKAEGAVIDLTGVVPGEEAIVFARRYDRDARQVQVVLDEARRVVRMENGVLITETSHGFVCANGGVDASNVGPDSGSLVTLLPLCWLLTVTMTAGLQKVFHQENDPKRPVLGFLQGADQAAEKMPALKKALADATGADAHAAAESALKKNQTALFNNRMDAGVTAVFLAFVAAIVGLSIREWLKLLGGMREPNLSETTPVLLPPDIVGRPPGHALGAIAIGALLIKEVSGEAAIERERVTQACECAKDPAKARRNVFLSATERQFRSPNRCC